MIPLGLELAFAVLLVVLAGAMIPDWSEFGFAVLFVVLVGVGFAWVVGQGQGTRQRITPGRTSAVALWTLGAAVTAFYGSQIASHPWAPPWYSGELGHSLFHLLWALLASAIAFALYRFRRAWLATGWTERCLVAANLLVRGIAVGNVLAGIGAAIGLRWEWRLDYVLANIFHDVGEILAVGSLLILMPVCIVMLGVGVRGALRPATAQPI
jgi:hypothetical protein